MMQWNQNQPIFVQIRQSLSDMILNGSASEGEALPSVRQIAADLQVNPLTVTRAFQELVDLGVVETRRGLGMFVHAGARDLLLAHERQKFLSEEWPGVIARLKVLGLDAKILLSESKSS